MKPNASVFSEADAFQQWLELPRDKVVIVERISCPSAEQECIRICFPFSLEILPDVFSKILTDREIPYSVVRLWSLKSASPSGSPNSDDPIFEVNVRLRKGTQ